MKWEAQFPSIDQARELQALGFPQDTAFHWTVGGEDLNVFAIVEWNEDAAQVASKICAAPTVAEMGEWLPPGWCTIKEDGWWWAEETEDGQRELGSDDVADVVLHARGIFEAEARALLLIALVRNHGVIDTAALK